VGLGLDSRAKLEQPFFTILPSSPSGRIDEQGGLGKVGNRGIFVKITGLLDSDADFFFLGQ
jgi:hypothetical protein